MLRLIQILEREIRGGMALLGAATIKDLKPELVGPLDGSLRVWADIRTGRPSKFSASENGGQTVGDNNRFFGDLVTWYRVGI